MRCGDSTIVVVTRSVHDLMEFEKYSMIYPQKRSNLDTDQEFLLYVLYLPIMIGNSTIFVLNCSTSIGNK